MTVKTTIVCDGFSCTNELDVSPADGVSVALRYSDWVQDPDDGWSQYCPECWAKIEK